MVDQKDLSTTSLLPILETVETVNSSKELVITTH